MSGELVRGAETPRDLAPMPVGLTGDQDLLASSRKRVLTSLDRDNPEDMKLFMAALGESDYNGIDGVNTRFKVRHFILRDAMRTNLQTKEMEPCLRLTVIDEDGKTFSTTSSVCIESFMLIASIRGYPPWTPAREMEIYPVKTRNNMRTYKFAEYHPEVAERAVRSRRAKPEASE